MKLRIPRTSKLLTLLTATCIVPVTFALNISFDNDSGAGDNNWETVANWDPAQLPVSADQAFINASATLQSAQTVRRVLVGIGNTLTIADGGDLTGSGSVALINDNASVLIQNGGSWTRGTTDLRAGTASITVQDGGTLDLGHLRASANGSLVINGSNSDVEIDQITTVNGNSSVFVSNNATLSLNSATLTVTDRIQWDGASTFTVGSGSTLNLGTGNNHIFTDGLTIQSGGTLGSGNNAALTTTAVSTGTVTLESGSTIDFSVNGESDTWDQFAFTDLSVTGGAGSVTLLLDMVAGDWKQSDPDLTLLSWSNSGPADFSFLDIQGAEGTSISTLGTLSYVGDASAGSIVLSGFEAFSIPEPSTAMLLGMGSMVMYLRRRLR